jgi:hypothetical protein
MVLFPAKTAAAHTFLDLFPGLMMKNARLNFSNSWPSGSCYCQIPDPGEAGSCQILLVTPDTPPGANHWLVHNCTEINQSSNIFMYIIKTFHLTIIRRRQGDLISGDREYVLETVIVIDTDFPEHSINIQYQYNILVKQWQQSTGAPHSQICLRASSSSVMPLRKAQVSEKYVQTTR